MGIVPLERAARMAADDERFTPMLTKWDAARHAPGAFMFEKIKGSSHYRRAERPVAAYDSRRGARDESDDYERGENSAHARHSLKEALSAFQAFLARGVGFAL